MQRNKYIYSLADAAMVVHSGDSGGTWTGAKENLKKQWVPLWVKQAMADGKIQKLSKPLRYEWGKQELLML